ncbi:MAG: hypothetical protein JXR47_04060 [Thiotrichales bacterium]|nr:hypothetical protein [Thiotrichales bacterium]
MQQQFFQEKFPIYKLQFNKSESKFATVDDIIAQLQSEIEANPKATLIAIFDHYSHTQSIEGEIRGDIKDAKNIIFCFGMKIPNPEVLAVRPRSIAVVDLGDSFMVSFMEPPMQVATDFMEDWCKALIA